MQINPIILPSWLSSKCVFQQGVELILSGFFVDTVNNGEQFFETGASQDP